jgi:hypothetical protein
MSQTGMSEKEIRSIKKYKLLTEAQLTPQLASPLSKIKKKIKKKEAEKLQLAPEHPKVVEKASQEFRKHLLTKISYHKDTDKRTAERHKIWELARIQAEKNSNLINKLRNFYY